MSTPIDTNARLGWSFDALEAAIARYNDARGTRPAEAFAAAAETAFWSATLNDYFWKRHQQSAKYVAERDADEDGKTVRALALYRNRVAHFIEFSHEGIRPGFSDAYSSAYAKYSHHFLPIDQMSFDDVEGEPHREEDVEKLYADHVAGVEIREVLERVERWWARCRTHLADLEVGGDHGA